MCQAQNQNPRRNAGRATTLHGSGLYPYVRDAMAALGRSPPWVAGHWRVDVFGCVVTTMTRPKTEPKRD